MDSSCQSKRTQLAETVEKLSIAITAFKDAEILTDDDHKSLEGDSLCLKNFINGSYKHTFMLKGDSLTGKTSFLNAVLGDNLIPMSCHDFTVIVQYSHGKVQPELFTAELAQIFNPEKRVFIVQSEHLKSTEVKGTLDIYFALKNRAQQAKTDVEAGKQVDLPVYIIQYQIKWLKVLDPFIAERIQFIDGQSLDFDTDTGKMNEMHTITSSLNNGDLYIAHELFTENVVKVYNNLKNQKYDSLLIINKIDENGSKSHFERIQDLDKLCSKLGISKEEILDACESHKETPEMRLEILKHGFYEQLNVEQKKSGNEILHFFSAINTLNRILIYYHQSSLDKAKLHKLFIETNGCNDILKAHIKAAKKKKIDIIQYYLEEEREAVKGFENFDFANNLREALSAAAKNNVMILTEELLKETDKMRKTLLNYDSYAELSQEEKKQLKSIKDQIKSMFEARGQSVDKNAEFFQEKFKNHLKVFQDRIQNISWDFYVVKFIKSEELKIRIRNLTEEWSKALREFISEYEKIELTLESELMKLEHENQGKAYIYHYLDNHVGKYHEKLQAESESIMKLIYTLAESIGSELISFVTDGSKDGLLTRLSTIIFRRRVLRQPTFESMVGDVKSTIDNKCQALMKHQTDKAMKTIERFESNFHEYLSSGKEGKASEVKELIQKYLK